MPHEPERFAVVVTLTDTGQTPPPIVRLRRLLKLALRAFGFRCTSIRPVELEPPQKPVGTSPP